MASLFPGALDSFTVPSGSSTLGGSAPTHTGLHQSTVDAVVAIETALGINPQGGSADLAARLTALDATVALKALDSLAMHLAGTETATGAKTFRNAAGIITDQGSTQDAVAIKGRAGGSSSRSATITTAALGASRTWTLADKDDTFAGLGAQTFTGLQTFSALLTASAGIAASGGDILLTRTDAASSVISARGLAGQQQLLEVGVASNRRWVWYRDASDLYILYEDNTGAGGTAGNRITIRNGGDEVGFASVSPVAGAGAIQLPTASTGGILFGDILVNRPAANKLKAATDGIVGSSISFTNGAAAAAGTLLNAPAAGNPTKWIPIDDNGTTRYIPAW